MFRNGKETSYNERFEKFPLKSTSENKYIFNDSNYKSKFNKIEKNVFKFFDKIPVYSNYYDIIELCKYGEEIIGFNVNLVFAISHIGHDRDITVYDKNQNIKKERVLDVFIYDETQSSY